MKKAFTLIELLVVVAIIGILAAVGTPIFQGFLEDSKETVTKNNHNHFVRSIGRDFLSCELGRSSISMKYVNGKARYFDCSKIRTTDFAYAVCDNFYANGYRNPYNKTNSGPCFQQGYNTSYKGYVGQSNISWAGSGIWVQTRINDKETTSTFVPIE
jgi:type IV pilus assembly protein PilA